MPFPRRKTQEQGLVTVIVVIGLMLLGIILFSHLQQRLRNRLSLASSIVHGQKRHFELEQRAAMNMLNALVVAPDQPSRAFSATRSDDKWNLQFSYYTTTASPLPGVLANWGSLVDFFATQPSEDLAECLSWSTSSFGTEVSPQGELTCQGITKGASAFVSGNLDDSAGQLVFRNQQNKEIVLVARGAIKLRSALSLQNLRQVKIILISMGDIEISELTADSLLQSEMMLYSQAGMVTVRGSPGSTWCDETGNSFGLILQARAARGIKRGGQALVAELPCPIAKSPIFTKHKLRGHFFGPAAP